MQLIIIAGNTMPPFEKKPSAGGGPLTTNNTIKTLSQQAIKAYDVDEDYINAIKNLGQINDLVENIKEFDRLIANIASAVHLCYMRLIPGYERTIGAEIVKQVRHIFEPKLTSAYINSAKRQELHEKLKNHAYSKRLS